MWLVMGCWVLAMISGFLWDRRYTGILTIATLMAFVWTQAAALVGWSGWVHLAAFVLTPWLLSAQQARDKSVLKRLHAEEATQMAHLAESARSFLSLQHSAQEMERQITEITDLYHVTKETSRALHLQELFTAILTMAPRLLDARGLRFIDLSGETPRVLRATRSSDDRMHPVPASEGGTDHPSGLLAIEQALVTQARSLGRSGHSSAHRFSCDAPDAISQVTWAPLWREQRPIGLLIAEELPESQLKTLSIVANQLSLQLSRVNLYQQVEQLAVTDALTGLSVRGYFMERAREELARSARHGLSCSLLMTDLDLFKEKNDTHGHLVGDVVLKEVARQLARNLREIDMIARFGGEEFILLLIETRVEQAMPIAERLRQLVEVQPIRAYDELLTQTISMGVAGFPEHAATLEALIERADQALYAAKRAGRNRVVSWSAQLTTV